MRKMRNGLIKNLRYLCLASVITLGLMTIIATGGGGGGGGGGGRGGGGDPDLAALEGTWFGTYLEGTDDFHTMTVTFDDSGHLNIDTVDGAPVNDTATLTKIEPKMFSFTDSTGVRGMIVVDNPAIHLGWMDEDRNEGVLQKGATQLSDFVVTDIEGQWEGEGFQLDADMDIVLELESSASMGNNAFSVDDNLNTDINGGFQIWASGYGIWVGLYNPNALGESGSFTVMLSVDKTFLTTFSIDNTFQPGNCPEDFRYRFFSLQ